MTPTVRLTVSTRTITAISVTLFAATLMGLTGCSDSKDPRTLRVELYDYAIKTKGNPVTLTSGVITITGINRSNETHELVLFKTDLAPDALPRKDDGSINERGTGLELIEEAEGIKAATTKSFQATVTPGKYVLACNLIENDKKHYMLGMFLPITVTEK
jgi:hypothetical protein